MRFTIDAEARTPASGQVRTQVIDAVRAGDLVAGTKLPTVRALAEQLGIAANTVAKAYRELESDGVIETRGRNGTFVRATGDPVEQRAQLAASDYATTIAKLGIDAPHAVELVRAALGLPRTRKG